jgi:hypothetical protein
MTRLLGILLQPQATWQSIRAEDPSWARVLARHALPLSLLPAVAWPLGRAAQGADDPWLAGFVATATFSLASLLLLALGFYLLAPFFRATRNWDRSVALASYAGTPLFLCGALLVVPLLVIASVGGLFYGLGLCAAGAPVMLDCKERDVAAYVASSAVFLGVSSTALGALCSAIGLI